MTTGYFAMSVFQETCILCKFCGLSDLLINLRRDASHTTKYILPVTDTKIFILIEGIPSGEKKSATSPTRKVPKGT